MPSATIKIFLVHGDPKRLRTAELSNWTGKAVSGPRSEFDDVLAREESQNSGVYFLTGIDPETGNNTVYIGEAESIRGRVKATSTKTSGTISHFSLAKMRILQNPTFATLKVGSSSRLKTQTALRLRTIREAAQNCQNRIARTWKSSLRK